MPSRLFLRHNAFFLLRLPLRLCLPSSSSSKLQYYFTLAPLKLSTFYRNLQMLVCHWKVTWDRIKGPSIESSPFFPQFQVTNIPTTNGRGRYVVVAASPYLAPTAPTAPKRHTLLHQRPLSLAFAAASSKFDQSPLYMV